MEAVDQLWAWQPTDEIVLEPLFHKCAIAQLVGDRMNIRGSWAILLSHLEVVANLLYGGAQWSEEFCVGPIGIGTNLELFTPNI